MKKLTLSLTAAALLAGSAGADEPRNLQPSDSEPVFAAAQPGELQFDFKLKGYVFGLRMIKARYMGKISDDRYAIYSDIKTSGLGAVLKKLRIWAISEGRYDAAAMHPERHTQQNLDKKSRRVEMRYDYGSEKIAIDINPPIGSQGVPPATPEERFSADDTLTGILSMMMRGQLMGGEVCTGTIRVFDSKQHYGLRMEKAGTKRVKYDGEKYEAIRCQVYYEPISGFDPEDLPDAEEGGTPIKVYLRKDEPSGLYVPLRLSYKISSFKAIIKLDDMTITKG